MQKVIVPFLILAAIVVGITLSSCDPYRKLAKSSVIADKDTAAIAYYNHKKYDEAVFLFEELVAVYRGHPRAEIMYYYLAYCKYFLGELVSSSFLFSDYAQKYPASEHAVEFEYMTAKCYYQTSDPYYLDQTYTDKAINQFQLFLSRHPESKHKDESMAYLTELRERLAKKAFEQANLYHKIGYHKAAVEAFKIMTEEYPDSKFREEAQYLWLKSAVDLSHSSISSKRLQRYNEAIEIHEKFVEKFPESKFANEAKNLLADLEKNKKKLEAEQQRIDEKSLYESFKSSMDVVMTTPDMEERKASYTGALDEYQAFQLKYPKSAYLKEADKLFKQYEEKFKD